MKRVAEAFANASFGISLLVAALAAAIGATLAIGQTPTVAAPATPPAAVPAAKPAAAQSVAPAAAPAAAPTVAPAVAPSAATSAARPIETGLGAVYSDRLNGHKTASGEVYDRNKLTAAHKTLPFGAQVKVTNSRNKKSTVVRINDRGPVQAGRILDLSPRAAKALGISAKGMAEVTAEVVGEPKPKARGKK